MSYDNELKSMLNADLLDKLFGYSINRLHNRAKAEELTQEICVELLKASSRATNIENMSAWIWSIAKYTYFKFMRNQSDTELDINDFEDMIYTYDFIEDSYHEDEIYRLRLSIADLSLKYREIIIHFYVYGKSIGEIAGLMKLPENTVKWRLFEARKALIRDYNNKKKGKSNMDNVSSKVYNPKRILFLADGWYKSQSDEALVGNNAGRLLLQNIMLEANCSEKSISELSQALAIPKAYIEDELRNATELGLMKKTGNDKYMTNFIIMPSDIKAKYCEIYQKYASYFYEKAFAFLDSKETEIRALNFSANNWEKNRLWWHMLTFQNMFGYESAYKKTPKLEIRSEMKPTGGWIGWCYEVSELEEDKFDERYTTFYGPFQDIRDYGISGCSSCFINEDKCCIDAPYHDYFETRIGYDLLRKLDNDVSIDELTEFEKELLAKMVANNFITIDNGTYEFQFPLFRGESFNKLKDILSPFGDIIAEEFSKMATEIRNLYRGINVPKTLKGELNSYMNIGITCHSAVIIEAVNRGTLLQPQDDEKQVMLFYACI